MIDHRALGVWRAVARVAARFADASQFAWAVLVDETLRTAAVAVRVAFESFRTEALGSVQVDSAKGVGAARLEDARIFALAVDAGFS